MEDEMGVKLRRRLLWGFLIVAFVMLVVIVAAVVGLFLYEPSPAQGFAFSSMGETIQLPDGRALAYLETGDPVGLAESSGDANLSAKDTELFSRVEYGADLVEALRQGVDGIARDVTLERSDWPFELEAIDGPPVLVFHGEEDAGVDPRISEYVCTRITSCAEPMIFPGEGHSVVFYRYEEIIGAMVEAWDWVTDGHVCF